MSVSRRNQGFMERGRLYRLRSLRKGLPSGAITLEDGKISVDNSKCNYCGRCFKACPTDAWDTIHGYIVSFGGLFGNSINKGETIIPFIENKEKLYGNL